MEKGDIIKIWPSTSTFRILHKQEGDDMGFLSNQDVKAALGRGAGMFNIPGIQPDSVSGWGRAGFYVAPENPEAGVVVILPDDSAMLVNSSEFVVDDVSARWIGEGSSGCALEVVGRAINVRRPKA